MHVPRKPEEEDRDQTSRRHDIVSYGLMAYPSSFEQFVVYEPWNPSEYRELKLIAKAIHGAVHLAEHIPTGELRAIKKIPNHNVSKRLEGQLENALVEIGASLYLSHHPVAAVSGIIQTHGAFRDETDTYLITEFAAGGELFDKVARMGHISEEHARRIGVQLLLAVKSLHDNGVCHRDLSLENTLIHADGSIRIIDFGQAEPLFDETGCEKYLVNAAGKLYYRAPEMYSGAYRGTAADMFAVGVELFILVFGTPPWCQATLTDDRFVFIQNCPDGFERLLARWKRQHYVSKEFRELIEQMIRAEPNKRPSADEALAHPALTRCDPTVDYTFLSCSTWFLPPAQRGAFVESELDFRNSTVDPNKSAYRNCSHENASAPQSKRAGRALCNGALFSAQHSEYVETSFKHGGPVQRACSEGSPERPEYAVQHTAFVRSRVSPATRPQMNEKEIFSPESRTPSSEWTRCALSHDVYVNVASSPVPKSRCVRRMKSPTFENKLNSDIPSTATTQRDPVSRTAVRNSNAQASITPVKHCVDAETPTGGKGQSSFFLLSSPASSISVSPTQANVDFRPEARNGARSHSCASTSPPKAMSAPAAQTPLTQGSVLSRDGEKKSTSAAASAAPNGLTQAKPNDVVAREREKQSRESLNSESRQRAGLTGEQTKPGSPGRKTSAPGRKNTTTHSKIQKEESRGTESSSSLLTALAASNLKGSQRDKLSVLSVRKDGHSFVPCPAARGIISSTQETVGVRYATGCTDPADGFVAKSRADSHAAPTAAKKAGLGRSGKATTVGACGDRKTSSQIASATKNCCAGADTTARRSATLLPFSVSPFVLRLRGFSSVLSRRLPGFKFGRSNQEQSTSSTKGSGTKAAGRT